MMLIESGLTVITGTMFGGKTDELLRRLNRLEAADFKTQLFKPEIDDRYDSKYVTSHNGIKKEAIIVNSVDEIIAHLKPEVPVLGIEEIQFLESNVVRFCNQQARDKIVIVAGLLKNFRDEYFPFKDEKLDMSELLRIADNIVYFNAICTYKENGERCTRDAAQIQRFCEGKVVPYDSPIVQVGGKEAYEPRCRQHFVPYSQVLDRLKVD